MLVIKGKGFHIEGGKGFQQYLQFCKEKMQEQPENGMFIPSGYNLKLFGEDITIEDLTPYNDFEKKDIKTSTNKEAPDTDLSKKLDEAESGEPNIDMPEVKVDGLFETKTARPTLHLRNFDKDPQHAKVVYYIPKDILYKVAVTPTCMNYDFEDLDALVENKSSLVSYFVSQCLADAKTKVEGKPMFYLAFRENKEAWKPIILRYLNKDKIGTRGNILIPAKTSMYFAGIDTLAKKIKMLLEDYGDKLGTIELAIKVAFKYS